VKTIKLLLSVLLLAGTLGVTVAPVWADGVILKVAANPQTNYCHMKFPAIRDNTLSWGRPVLKDASDGDIIDFYGPCDHDPVGKAEISAQRAARYDQFRQGQE
jgi:hypothetical protein